MRGLARSFPTRFVSWMIHSGALRGSPPRDARRARFELPARAASRLWLRGRLREFVLYKQLRTPGHRRTTSRLRARRADASCAPRRGVRLPPGAWSASRTPRSSRSTTRRRKARSARSWEATRETPSWFVPGLRGRAPASVAGAWVSTHDPSLRTMTVLEGVLMYLTEEARKRRFECIGAVLRPGPPNRVHLHGARAARGRSRDAARQRRAVSLVGEPFPVRFEPSALPAWLTRAGSASNATSRAPPSRRAWGLGRGAGDGRTSSCAASFRARAPDVDATVPVPFRAAAERGEAFSASGSTLLAEFCMARPVLHEPPTR